VKVKDVKLAGGRTTVTGVMSHNDMEKAVGDAIAAFVSEAMESMKVMEKSGGVGGGDEGKLEGGSDSDGDGVVEPMPCGVFFPEEIPSVRFRQRVLRDIKDESTFCSKDYSDGRQYSKWQSNSK
jgi:hypothetical protein